MSSVEVQSTVEWKEKLSKRNRNQLDEARFSQQPDPDLIATRSPMPHRVLPLS